MNATSRDFYADCNRDNLFRAVRRTGLTHEEVADEASRELRKIGRAERRKRRGDGVPTGVSRQLIGQLLSGKATSTHELRAVAIERALGMDDCSLFAPRVYRGTRDAVRQTA